MSNAIVRKATTGLSVLLLSIGLIGPFSSAARAAGPAQTEPDTMASIVVDLKSGKVLSADHATERRYPASTTKLMTAYLVLKALDVGSVKMDTPVVMTRRASMEAPSKMGFEPGSVMRLDNALRMMLVKSANDVAYAIGQTLGNGSMETFVAMMNRTAGLLAMRDTTFVNPNVLPGEGQHSSAKDLAILAMAIRKEFPGYLDYFGTEAIAYGNSVMKNGNKLLGRYDGADGMKTGYICASGFNLVSSATRGDRTLIAVVLGANGTIERESRSADILEAGFKADPAAIDKTVKQLPIDNGETVDISDYICSQAGRTARANDRVADRNNPDEVFGSPYLAKLTRAPKTVRVALGGAAAGPNFDAGIAMIPSYGIPLPRWRPTLPQDHENLLAAAMLRESVDVPGQEAEAGDRGETHDSATSADLEATHNGIPVPRSRPSR